MSDVPYNDSWKQQQKKLVRATFKKGFINAVNLGSRTVDVSYVENPQNIVRNIPVADSVDITKITVGKKCRVDVFDETNPNDCVLAFTF